jgi:3-hydroxyacyl-CoA dehydrogenase/enoyl-CoA hydratase/3-hydroxybutyryl-CoA epimerase
MTERIHCRITEQRICVLTLDRPDSSANFFDKATLKEFGARLDFIEQEPSLRGLVITSAKPFVFIAGADLGLFSGASVEKDVRDYIETGQRYINRLASLRIPTVAAIHGAALGGGYEVCLACDWRIASESPATKIGLPETTWGLLPAWGGTLRLPRLIGFEPALEMILSGKTSSTEQARDVGLVDEVAEPQSVQEAAFKRILGEPLIGSRGSGQPLPSSEATVLILEPRRKAILDKTRGHNPALMKALEVIAAGVDDSPEVCLARERDALLELVKTESTQNLLRLFSLRERVRKAGRQSAGQLPAKRVAVIGAGTMGAGIAYVASSHGLSVTLRDVDTETTAKGLNRVARLYEESVNRRAISKEDARAGLERITAGLPDAPLDGTDVVIEAVAEILEVKLQLFRQLDQTTSSGAILATNTSALSISELAGATQKRQRVVGLHFFNPVNRMQLVEIIHGPQTAPETIQRAQRFAQQLGKLPVLVRDSPGFVVNRVLMPYLLEAVRLHATGTPCEDVDEAMLDFGMAMGPLRVIDEIGIDVVLQIAGTLERHFGERDRAPEALRQLRGSGRLGRKSGEGFFRYAATPKDQPKSIRVAESASIAAARGPARTNDRSALQDRMVLLMINEAARCIEEEVVREAADLDFAMITGAGFGAFLGGPLRYADSIGAQRLVERMEVLAAQADDYFSPGALLRKFGAEGRKFYP